MWYIFGLFVAWFGMENIKSLITEDGFWRGVLIVIWCVTSMAIAHRMNDLVFIVHDDEDDENDENEDDD